MWSTCWENYKYEFRLYLQNLSGICKMGITFAYELGLKSFLYEKSSTRKVTGISRSRGKKIQKNSNLLMAHLPMVCHYYLPAFKIQNKSKNKKNY